MLDNEYVFSLYNSEIKKYNIEEECYVDEDFVNKIEKEVLYPRAKDRALYILGRCDKTEKQLRDKLAESFYPQCIIDSVVELLKSYGYVDDERYAHSYIKMKQSVKSRKKIECELIQKGVNMQIIKNAFDDECEDSELDALRNLLNKTKYKSMLDDKISRNKVVASMMRRGFVYEQITRCIDEIVN